MQSVGPKLRHAREAQRRTLEQVNSSTRISVKVLEAIEADDLSSISSAFLYKSFARQFAADVGLDYSSELASSVEVTAERIPAPRIPGQGTTHAPKVAALPLGRKENSRMFYSITSFGVVVVACSGLYAAWQKSKVSFPMHWQDIVQRVRFANRVPTVGRQDTRQSAAKTSQNPAEDGTFSASAPIPQDKAESNEAQAGFTLELSATEPAWLSIIADGKPSFNGILEKAETKVLQGHHTARIRTGNAGGVEVVFNGKPLGALGPRGQIRTVLFTRDNYEVLHRPGHVSLVEFTQTAELKLPLDAERLPEF
jgi:cytoskeleton protein RodZ